MVEKARRNWFEQRAGSGRKRVHHSDSAVILTGVHVLDGTSTTHLSSPAAGGLPELQLTGLVARPDGTFLLKRSVQGAATDAARLGAELGAGLRADCPRDVLG